MATPMKQIQIPCCLCGTMILPNAANQCSTCLAQEMDLRALLQRGPGGADEIIIHQCRKCRKFARTEKNFDYMDLESPELLALCLKHIPALQAHAIPRLHLVDAMWIWTEPNSMRLKLRLTVRSEVEGVTIQQRVAVELKVQFKQCPECNREYTNRTWHALVQLRQKRNDDAPRKGLAVLEMALARNKTVRKHVLSIDTSKQGFDFYFLSLAEAQTFASYLARIAPMRIKTTKKLLSTDVKSNTANMRYTVACDMVPLCRDDLLIVHRSAKGHLSGRLCLVTKMSSVVHLVDASPKRYPTMEHATGEVAPETYYKSGADKLYQVLSSSRRMVPFVVLDVELCGGGDPQPSPLYEGPASGVTKYALADVEVARASDFGVNDETFHCVTHLGHLLQPGDTVLGYDMAAAVTSGTDEGTLHKALHSSFVMPDVVLVKKLQGADKEDGQEEKVEKAKSGRAKKREKRRKREEKKMRELEEAAGRMGFLEQPDASFEQELQNDPELAEELLTAEAALGTVGEEGTVGTEQSEATDTILDGQDGVTGGEQER